MTPGSPRAAPRRSERRPSSSSWPDRRGRAAARRTALAPASPNPFNPSTELRFTVARQGRVSLRIFDERGRLVRDLVGETLAAGEHVANWDGRDGGGRAAASGVYVAELRTSDARELRKLTLVK